MSRLPSLFLVCLLLVTSPVHAATVTVNGPFQVDDGIVDWVVKMGCFYYRQPTPCTDDTLSLATRTRRLANNVTRGTIRFVIAFDDPVKFGGLQDVDDQSP